MAKREQKYSGTMIYQKSILEMEEEIKSYQNRISVLEEKIEALAQKKLNYSPEMRKRKILIQKIKKLKDDELTLTGKQLKE